MAYCVGWAIVILSVNGLLAGHALASDIPCAYRPGEQGQGWVCVCNSSYCDTLQPPSTLPRGQYHHYSTSQTSPGFSHTVGNFSTESSFDSGGEVFTVNSSVQFQEIIGFGGSFSDTVGILLNSLPEAARDKFIETYYGPSGLEYTMGRVPIGGSDFSTRRYTLDDVPFDEDLRHFNLTFEDFNYKIPMIKKAMSVSPHTLKLLACTWFSPDWMKLNNNQSADYIHYKYFDVWAQYHVKFLQAYQQLGLDMWAVSGGNEVIFPIFMGKQGVMESATMTAVDQRVWFSKHLRTQMNSANFSNVKLIGLEDMRLFALYWMQRLAADPEGYQSFDGIGLHWYLDFFISPTVLDAIHRDYPDKLLLYTESCINVFFASVPVILGSWARGEYYIYNIIENLNHWAQSIIDWNLALDQDGGPCLNMPVDAPIIVNQTSGEFYKQPSFYGLGHFSKFLPPGARRIQVLSNQNQSSSTDHAFPNEFSEDILQKFAHANVLKRSGFQSLGASPGPPYFVIPQVVVAVATDNPDESCTVIVFNSKNETARVRVEDPRVGSFTLDLEEHSVHSFVYWP